MPSLSRSHHTQQVHITLLLHIPLLTLLTVHVNLFNIVLASAGTKAIIYPVLPVIRIVTTCNRPVG